MIELIEGVEVEGTVVAHGTALPVQDAQVGVYGPYRPRSGAMTRGQDRCPGPLSLPSAARRDLLLRDGAAGRLHNLAQRRSSRTVTIPEGVAHFVVPPIEIEGAVTVRGRIVDSAGEPVPRAKIVGICQGALCTPLGGPDTFTDANGVFQLPPNRNNTVAIGAAARLQIVLADGSEHEAAVMPGPGGSVKIKLPILGTKGPHVAGPTEVRPGELAGVVVDPDGKPIEGVEVDAWTWYAGNETKTDAQRLVPPEGAGPGPQDRGAVPQAGATRRTSSLPSRPASPAGSSCWETRRTSRERSPTPRASRSRTRSIRANNGPKQADGVMITEIWTEARTDAEGRYRMYAQEDVYDIQVRVPGVGVARLPQTALGADEARHLDIPLKRGVVFRARTVDSETERRSRASGSGTGNTRESKVDRARTASCPSPTCSPASSTSRSRPTATRGGGPTRP